MLIDTALRDVLDAFSSAHPTPGGGSAAAIAAATGSSLLLMVTALPRSRSGSEEDRAMLNRAASALPALREQLTASIDEDSAAYNQVMAAYKEPKATEQEQASRKASIQRALRTASDVPLAVVRLSSDALQQARVVAAHGHRAASSDTGVAVELLAAGMRGARLNVEANLASMTDAEYKDSVARELQRLVDEGTAAADAARMALLD